MTDRIGVVIPCRLDSRRLPGKVLSDVAGAPLLTRLLARVRFARVWDAIVLATTDRSEDDAIADFAHAAGIDVFRGPLDDVARRLLGAADAYGLDWFFRVNGDSPCVDPALLTAATARIAEGDVDFVTNLAPRRFPHGIAIEAVRSDTYRTLARGLDADAARERPTSVLYEGGLRIGRIEREGPSLADVRLTVDTPADLERIRGLLEWVGPERWPGIGYAAIAALCEGVPVA